MTDMSARTRKTRPGRSVGAIGPKRKGVTKRMAKKLWIQEAIKRPGALHRALKVPLGQKIPAQKIAGAAKKGGRLAKMANLAKTLSRLRRQKK